MDDKEFPKPWKVWSVSDEQDHIKGPYYVEDKDGGVVREGLELEEARKIVKESER